MDLLNNTNANLIDFITNYNFSQEITEPTRVVAKYYNKKNEFVCSKTLIDVIIHNSESVIKKVRNYNCPFSDHKFITAALDFKKIKDQQNYFIGRNMSIKNINSITEKINEL